jgi:hypothetical protein
MRYIIPIQFSVSVHNFHCCSFRLCHRSPSRVRPNCKFILYKNFTIILAVTYTTSCYFCHVRPANQPTIMGVALCHIKFEDPRSTLILEGVLLKYCSFTDILILRKQESWARRRISKHIPLWHRAKLYIYTQDFICTEFINSLMSHLRTKTHLPNYNDPVWHSKNRASWNILITKPKWCTNFSNLFLE